MYDLNHRIDGNRLIIEPQGRIDTNNAPDFEKALLGVVSENEGKSVEINGSKLEYISSAGLRVLMKLRKLRDEKLLITEVSPDVYDIFETTGFIELFDIKKRMREVSVEGCKILGKGGNGAVYRLNDETIVKVYFGERNSAAKIDQNRAVTKDVFLHGIPTTIAFDMVRVGENLGVVFEMIDAKSMAQEITSHPEKTEEYANMIADTLIQLHHTEFEPGSLPDSRDRCRADIKATVDKGLLKPMEAERLYRLVDDIPYRNTFVHQDFHPGNMMLDNGKIVLIDVEDAGLGHPVLDLSSMYLVYVTAAKGKKRAASMGMTPEGFSKAWDIIIRKYFSTNDPKEIAEINRILYGYSLIKMLRGLATSDSVSDFIRKPAFAVYKHKLFSMIDTLHPIP